MIVFIQNHIQCSKSKESSNLKCKMKLVKSRLLQDIALISMHNLDFFVKWTLEIYPGLQQKILSGLRRKSNPMTLMMSSLKATFPPTFCTGRRYYSQVWWRQFPYSDPNLNRFSKPTIYTKNFEFLHLYLFWFKEVKIWFGRNGYIWNTV